MPSPVPALQAAAYTRLAANITSATSYDYMPTVDPVSGAEPARPWIAMIGESSESERINKASRRHLASVTLRAESATYGGSEVRDLCNSIVAAFDTALTVTGYTVDDTPDATVSRFADFSESGSVVYVGIVDLRFTLQG